MLLLLAAGSDAICEILLTRVGILNDPVACQFTQVSGKSSTMLIYTVSFSGYIAFFNQHRWSPTFDADACCPLSTMGRGREG